MIGSYQGGVAAERCGPAHLLGECGGWEQGWKLEASEEILQGSQCEVGGVWIAKGGAGTRRQVSIQILDLEPWSSITSKRSSEDRKGRIEKISCFWLQPPGGQWNYQQK